MGDGTMATFNSRGDQPDQVVRAADAGLALQQGKASALNAYVLHSLPG
jgi:hypothetical protein